jgi:aminopeptidase N
MQLYFERHDGSAACDDFVQAMEDASNVDLSHFRRWYSQSGTPIVTVHDDYNPETEQYTLTISQRTPPTAEQPEKQPLHIPFDIELYDNEGKVIPLQKGGHPVHTC